MKVTAGCLLAFATLLEPSDLASGPGAGCSSATPDIWLEGLIRFEGALAWESGQPRSAVPAMVLRWAEDAWLAGWDHADARFYHADPQSAYREAA